MVGRSKELDELVGENDAYIWAPTVDPGPGANLPKIENTHFQTAQHGRGRDYGMYMCTC